MKYDYLLIILLVLAVLLKGWLLYQDYRPHIATVLLPDGHSRLFLEYWNYYSWYDKNGNQIWSKRIKRKYLFTI